MADQPSRMDTHILEEAFSFKKWTALKVGDDAYRIFASRAINITRIDHADKAQPLKGTFTFAAAKNLLKNREDYSLEQRNRIRAKSPAHYSKFEPAIAA